LTTVLTSVPFGVRAGQDGRDRRAALHVINVHRRKTALVVMRVPERKLLTAMGGAERVVDVENLQLARLHGRAELIEESCRAAPHRSCSAHSPGG
jgi:hypothetical protein